MASQLSPFVETNYGWPYGSSGWNLEMDANLVKFSYLHDRNIDAIVSSLPAISNGSAYFNTSDNRLYFDVGGQRYSSNTPKWFIVTLRSSGQTYQFDGSALNATDKPRKNSVVSFGADPTGAIESTSSFVAADTATGGSVYVPSGLYLVNPATINIKSLYGPGKLVYTTSGSRWVGLNSKGTLYIRNDDVNGDLTPNVPTDGFINLADGELRFFCDLDGDGDYDADMFANNNMYLACGNSIHMILGTGLGDPQDGRIRFLATGGVNYIQSGLNFSGTLTQSLAITRYDSSVPWMYFDDTLSGFVGVGHNAPLARMHIKDTGATTGLYESTGSTTSRVGFKGTGTTATTTVTLGCSGDDMIMRAGGADRIRLVSDGSFTPNVDGTQTDGSSARRWLSSYSRSYFVGTGTVQMLSGSGTPEGVVTAPVGSTFQRSDGGAVTSFYVKETGVGNTGWVAK